MGTGVELEEIQIWSVGGSNPASDPSLILNLGMNGNAKDLTAKNPPAQVYGATPTTDRFGQPQKAFHFNGVDQYIAASVSELPIGGNPRTLIAWVKPEDQREYPGFINYGNGSREGGVFGIGMNMGLGTGAFLWGHGRDFQSLLALPSDQWSFVAVRYQYGTAQVTVGAETRSFSFPPQLQLDTLDNGILWIGAFSTLGDTVSPPNEGGFAGRFKGSLDDVRIYNRVLSEAEIREIFMAENPKGTDDPDGDGFTTDEEQAGGSNPFDSSSVPVGLNALRAVELQIVTQAGKMYQLESSTDRVHWTPDGDVFPGTGGRASRFVRAHPTDSRFWRLTTLP